MPKRLAQESLIPTPKEGKPSSSKKKISAGGILANKKKKVPKPVSMKRRAQESLVPTPIEEKPSPSKKRSLTGGILANKNKKYTSVTVNIRPSTWVDKSKPSQFWIGKIGSFERAQLVADAVYFYVGEPPFHIKDVVREYPSITCIGIVPGKPVVLSTQEMFCTYTAAIAKGVEFKPQRQDFIAQVKGVIKMDNFPFPAPPDDDDVEHDEGEDTTPMEYDENAAMAIGMSSNVDVPGSDPVHVLFPSFELQHTECASHLYSVGQCSTSQFMPYESIDDCRTFQDEEVWKQFMNEFIDQSASGVSDGEGHRENVFHQF